MPMCGMEWRGRKQNSGYQLCDSRGRMLTPGGGFQRKGHDLGMRGDP